ncbi:MAG: hypothetical protein CVU39_00005, partial [Chloroflexi bacterium HGW-Chloroflexi-10]
TSLRLLPSQKDVQDNVAALGALCVGARCVFVVKKIQSERMCFREMTGMGGGCQAEIANLVFYGGYTVLERMGERMGKNSDE